jgi:hypothetical protein
MSERVCVCDRVSVRERGGCQHGERVSVSCRVTMESIF